MARTMALGAALPVMLMSWSARDAETEEIPGRAWREVETDFMQASQERGTANVVSNSGRERFGGETGRSRGAVILGEAGLV